MVSDRVDPKHLRDGSAGDRFGVSTDFPKRDCYTVVPRQDRAMRRGQGRGDEMNVFLDRGDIQFGC